MANTIIGISGGSGSGKTTLCNLLTKQLENFVYISQDNYYKSADHINNSNITEFNFDHPDAFDSELLFEHLSLLKNNKPIEMPQYDFVKHKRKSETQKVQPQEFIILDGIMIFHYESIRKLIDYKVYIDAPDDLRFIRRLQRDLAERGRTVESVIKQYLEVVRPGHIEFIEPTKQYADLVIPEGGQNEKALAALTSFVKRIKEKE